jgi:hypothetical protein
MNTLGFIEAARRDGLRLSVSGGDKLHILGDAAKVKNWKPILAEHKARIVSRLTLYPMPADLLHRIRTMARRWRYTEDDLLEVLSLAEADPHRWLLTVNLDERKFGNGDTLVEH